MATSKFVSGRVENVGSMQITITEDKLRNILLRHVGKLRKSREWVGALFTTVSLIATLYACSFKELFGLSADTWKGAFLVFAAIAVIAFLYFCLNAYNNRTDEERIIEEIKTPDSALTMKERYSYGIRIEEKRVSFFKERTEWKNPAKE